jgi:hypothetical protein
LNEGRWPHLDGLVPLTKTFDPEVFVRGLAEWPDLDLQGKHPVLTSLLGDVFFAAQDGYWYLSTIDGSLTDRGPDRDALVCAISTPMKARISGCTELSPCRPTRRGVTITEQQVYVFAPHPVFTGRFDPELIIAMDLVIAMSVIAQALAQTDREKRPWRQLGDYRTTTHTLVGRAWPPAPPALHF